MTANSRGIILSLLASLLVFLVFVGIVWRAGLLRVTGDAPNADVVAASLALVGAFLGSAITLAGTLLKYSIDNRAERRAELDAERNADSRRQTDERLRLEGERNAALQREAESRLQLEAAIRAVQLFATSTGSLAPREQLTGALYSLVSLRQYELTLALAEHLAQQRLLDPSALGHILNEALLAEDEDIKHTAINLFESHSEWMLTPAGGVTFPSVLLTSLPDQPPYVRFWATIGLANILVSRASVDWNLLEANAVFAALASAWEGETDAENKQAVGLILKAALPALPELTILNLPRRKINLQVIWDQLERVGDPASDQLATLIWRLESWVSTGPIGGNLAGPVSGKEVSRRATAGSGEP